MGGFNNPIIGGRGNLVYPGIQSPNFNQATLAGWAILKTGIAFFYQAVLQGLITGNTFIRNSSGAIVTAITNKGLFVYLDTGSATQGAMIMSVASVSGNDPVNGTPYGPGLTGIDPAFGDSLNVLGASIAFGQVAFTQDGQVNSLTGATSTGPRTQVNGPEQGQAGHLQMQLYGTSPDGTVPAGLVIGIATGAGSLTRQTSRQLEIQGADGNIYTAGQITLITAGTYLVSGTAFTEIAPGTGPALGFNAVKGTYKIDALIFYITGAAAGTPRFLIGGTATATAKLVSWSWLTNSATNDPAVSPAPTDFANAMNGIPMTLAGQVYVTQIRGSVVVTVAGSVQVQVATSVAGDDFTVEVGSQLQVFPA